MYKRQSFIPIILFVVIVCDIALLHYKYYVQKDNLSSPKVILKESKHTVLTSNTSLTNNKNKLEFIHISKTGGSAIELEASKKGITWGACHYVQIESNGDACQQPDLHDKMKQNRGYNKTKGYLNCHNTS